MNTADLEALLRSTLRYADGVWITHVAHAGPEGQVEISVRGSASKPDETHLTEAAVCIASLSDLRSRMEHALNSVSEGDPLFPPVRARSWWIEALSFMGDEPEHGVALFTLNEDGYNFIYVEYVVELRHARVVSASARTR